jgi:hypothetical protein
VAHELPSALFPLRDTYQFRAAPAAGTGVNDTKLNKSSKAATICKPLDVFVYPSDIAIPPGQAQSGK